MSARRIFLAITALGFSVSGTRADDTDQGLRYGFEKGQTVVYEVRIEADQNEYLEVYTGRPRYTVIEASDDEVSLTFTGTLEPSEVAKPGSDQVFGIRRSIFLMNQLSGIANTDRQANSQITIDRSGVTISSEGSSQLPYLLGNLSSLMLERLPSDSAAEWSTSRDLTIVPSDGFPRIMLRSDGAKRITATETIRYRRTGQEGDLVTISRTYRLATAEKVRKKPRFEIEGESQLIFDQRQGLYSSMTCERTVTTREQNVTRETPLKITCRLLDDAAVAEAEREASRSLTESELEDVLDDLNTKDKALGRILQLQRQTPATPDPEVGKALTQFLESPEQNTRFAAAKALEHWATTSDLPALTKAMADPFMLVRQSALKSVVRIKPADALNPAIGMMTGEGADRLNAVEAIRRIGVPAEDSLINLLKHEDWMVRLEAVRLLSDFGTTKSLAPLKPLKQKDDQALIRKLAGDAIDAIREREPR